MKPRLVVATPCGIRTHVVVPFQEALLAKYLMRVSFPFASSLCMCVLYYLRYPPPNPRAARKHGTASLQGEKEA